MPVVEAAGATVAYTVSGEGPGVLLLHGTGGSAATTWPALAPALDAGRTLVATDLPGSGDTVDDGGELELAALAEGADAAARAAGLETYSVVGFSLGAAVAAALAAARRERVRALVLLNGPGEGGGARARLQFDLWRDLHAADPELFARLWMLTGFGPGFLAGLPVAGLKQAAAFPVAAGLGRQCELAARLRLDGVLEAIAAPTLVIAGAADWIVPAAELEEVAARIPRAEYQVLDCGHFSILERPAELADRIVDFLDARRE